MRNPRLWLPALLVLSAGAASPQNLFVNADLDEDLAGWQLACGTTLSYQATEDEAGCPNSGSAHSTSGPCVGFEGAGAGQCVPVTEGVMLHATGRVRAPAGFVGVALRYFESADCTGDPLLELTSPPGPASGAWQTASFSDLPPVGALSVALGFGAVNVSPVDVDVDAGFVGPAPLIFRDGFDGDADGSTAACRWSSTVP